MNPAARLFFNNWYFDKVYYYLLGRTGFGAASLFSYIDSKVIDRAIHIFATGNVVLAHLIGWFDRTIVDGLVNFSVFIAGRTGGITRSLQLGKIQAYFSITLIALILFIIWLIF
jgi:NADH-quinone oxidoreductase subunit L